MPAPIGIQMSFIALPRSLTHAGQFGIRQKKTPSRFLGGRVSTVFCSVLKRKAAFLLFLEMGECIRSRGGLGGKNKFVGETGVPPPPLKSGLRCSSVVVRDEDPASRPDVSDDKTT